MSALNSLDKLVGLYVCTSRPRTPLEEKAYGGPAEEGGCGVVVSVGEPVTITREWRGEREQLTGREIVVDYGMAWLITAETKVEVVDNPYPEPDEAALQRVRSDTRPCICDKGPNSDGPEQTCPQHGDVRYFAQMWTEASAEAERLRAQWISRGDTLADVIVENHGYKRQVDEVLTILGDLSQAATTRVRAARAALSGGDTTEPEVLGRCPGHALTHCWPCGWVTDAEWRAARDSRRYAEKCRLRPAASPDPEKGQPR